MTSKYNPGAKVETGPITFPQNLPGIYIKGDEAVYWSVMLTHMLGSYGVAKTDKDSIAIDATAKLIHLLKAVNG